ncbi:MAG: PAS domain-containing protein [Candidatus Omnitrophica bacterium]|nr:PAS domain-containing protein [Candidatus Omnitrophota bacterium]
MNKKHFFTGWIPFAIVVWAAIFGIYEIIERTFLSSASPDLLRILHIARGTCASFLLAALVAWYMIKKGGVQSQKKESEIPDFPYKHFDAIGPELEKRLGWLVRLRWVAISSVLLTIFVTSNIFRILSPYSVFALALIAAAMAGYNLIFSYLLKKVHAPKAHAFAQVLLDLVSLTLMLHFSGGIENPFFAFFVFHVIIGSILLEKYEAYFIGLVTCFLFCGMVILESRGIISHYSFLKVYQSDIFTFQPYIFGILFAFVATTLFSVYFTTTIMENLRQRKVELQRTGELLAQEKGKLDDIVKSIGAGLLVIDKNHRMVWANEKINEWFGSVRMGEYCYIQCCKCDCVPVECPTNSIFEDGTSSNWEKAVETNGRKQFFMVTATPIRDLRGNITHVLALIQDITKMKEVEIQLVQADKMVAVGQLASGIAHELNNPLAVVSASSELLKEMAQDETFRGLKEFETFTRHLTRIEEQVYRCKEIIQSLLGFARRDEEGFVRVNVRNVLDDTIRIIQDSARARGHEIVCNYNGNLPSVQANPRQLQQVFLNIFMNALDAMEKNGRITVRAYKEKDDVAVEISDTGKGILPDDITKIFDPFFTTKPPGKGTGLGLYLVHQIMQAQKGSITVSSEAGKGSVFTVFIPTVG